jgi:hypothetical protein
VRRSIFFLSPWALFATSPPERCQVFVRLAGPPLQPWASMKAAMVYPRPCRPPIVQLKIVRLSKLGTARPYLIGVSVESKKEGMERIIHRIGMPIRRSLRDQPRVLAWLLGLLAPLVWQNKERVLQDVKHILSVSLCYLYSVCAPDSCVSTCLRDRRPFLTRGSI